MVRSAFTGVHAAPPHTRGSTQCHRVAAWGSPGSPAHAGIDPRSGPVTGARMRLPRTRGDRPAATAIQSQRREAPPHTRGSTAAGLVSGYANAGSPAHAGIDPRDFRCARVHHGLPRTRGDRPFGGPSVDLQRVAPPHTRGSTVSISRGEPPELGSPAHAGIDPGSTRLFGRALRLPRTRGDRPARTSAALPVKMAPPHTRGSTITGPTLVEVAYGSPAHAGIDPVVICGLFSRRWLPRTRGDRPAPLRCHLTCVPAPPHTRGSTQRAARHPEVRCGSPAHAGIDPTQRGQTRPIAWLPRTRGDRPCSSSGRSDPTTAPPHTRGSTRPRDRPLRRGMGSPAHAGIDLTADADGGHRPWLPRTRGDRLSSATNF